MDSSDSLNWVPLVGILATGAFTLAGVQLGGRREAKHWLRSERMSAYSEFLSQSDKLMADDSKELIEYITAPAMGKKPPSVTSDHVSSLARIAIVGPGGIYDVARRLSGTWSQGKTDVIEAHVDGGDALSVFRDLTRETGKLRASFIATTSKLLQSTR